MQASNPDPVLNSLLAALPLNEHPSLRASIEPVALRFSEVIYLPGEPISHVYFPTGSLISLITVVEGHQDLEVGMVGHDGMLGTPLALGLSYSPVRAKVQGAGMALRMTASDFQNEFLQNPLLQRVVHRYTFNLIGQLAQMAACNLFHHVEARLACRLLMTRDRMRSNRLHLTHDLLGNMLGVRRVGVTKAAGDLRQRKLISYNRGDIVILDGDGLESAACQCYQRV